MNKRFWMAYIAVYVAHAVLSFLVHGIVLGATYEALAQLWRPKAEMDAMMPIMFASNAVWLFLFCWIFTRGYENQGVAEGVRYGALIGLFVSVMSAFDSYVIYPLPLRLVLIWLVSSIVTFTLLGAVLAAIYRRDPARHERGTQGASTGGRAADGTAASVKQSPYSLKCPARRR